MRSAALGRKHTEEVRREMSESRRGTNNPFFGKTHSEEALALIKAAAKNREKPPVPGIEVDITDLETKLTTTYDSVRKAADAINSDIKTILRREKSQLTKGINTPYRGRYMIVIKRS
jgi:group I intron endonuclease